MDKYTLQSTSANASHYLRKLRNCLQIHALGWNLRKSYLKASINPCMFSYSERAALIEKLSNIPLPQFNTLVFSLKPPGGILPSDTAPQRDRSIALLNWVETNGPGINELQNTLNQFWGIEPAPQDTICPYKGLSFFDFNDEDYKYFYGREALTKELLDKVQKNNFLAVVGASGSGKSSVLRAGVLQKIKNEENHEIRVLVPGENPLQNLALAFVEKNLSRFERAEQLRQAEAQIRSGSEGLRSLIQTSEMKRVILLIDQFEEVFSICQDETEREAFFKQLVNALKISFSKLCLIIAMRSDFLPKCLEKSHEGLAKKIQNHLKTVLPMTSKELSQAITAPAHQVGLSLQSGLDQALLDDVNRAPGKLPLLQYTLTELWKRRENRTLSLSTYVELGRVTGTLRNQADQVYQAFSAEQKAIARSIFLSLTLIEGSDAYMRRRITQESLVFSIYTEAQIAEVIKYLSDKNLIVTSEIIDEETNRHMAIFDLAHEELIYSWPQLKSWLEEDREFQIWQQNLNGHARKWMSSGRDEGFLLRGMVLQEADNWLNQRNAEIPLATQELITKSLESKKIEEDRKRQAEIAKASIIGLLSEEPILAGSKIISSGHSDFDASDRSDRISGLIWDFQSDAINFVQGHTKEIGEIKFRITKDNTLIERNLSTVPALAARILASPDIYLKPNREPNRSINFITYYDGSTLNDLVSHAQKQNGEFNGDDTNDDYSWKCGIEGPTNNAEVEQPWQRQIKNLFTLLFIAQGTPMLMMGDEVRRTQLVNNDFNCQDSKMRWFNWDLVEKEQHLLRFVQGLIHFTQSLKILQIEHLIRITQTWCNEPHIVWHGLQLGQPDWSENSRVLAFTLRYPEAKEQIHIMLNAHWDVLMFELPSLNSHERWHRIVDTAATSPRDFCYPEESPTFDGSLYPVSSHSSVVLMSLEGHEGLSTISE